MKSLFCKIFGHIWTNNSLTELIRPTWYSPEEKEKWFEDLANKKCAVCGITPQEVLDMRYAKKD